MTSIGSVTRGGAQLGSQIPGFNTVLFYHPELEAVVVGGNDDYMAGDCPQELNTATGGPRGIACETPEDRISAALTQVLGKPFPHMLLRKHQRSINRIESTMDE